MVSGFFPAAGYYNNGKVNNAGSNGNYWSSTPNGSNNAYNLNFSWGSQKMDSGRCYNGYSVRAILKESN